ncbi:IS66 family insertion sequence element accessory protein TnpB, partial [Mesorhizobium sp.]|uniref:IS66 family insertion sequence element accessory protein TnpB n=1 Tax=Mesorhizobium sp. TaxID=1871066 RepID=UPI0025BB6BB3
SPRLEDCMQNVACWTDRIKLVFWDGTGVCLYAKRLADGEFRWPKVQHGVMRLTAAQLSALLEGLIGGGFMKPAGRSLRRRRVDWLPSESAWIPLSPGTGEYGLIRSWR